MITRNDIHENRSLTISLHREMWTWLADNPSKRKEDWPRWISNGGDVEAVTASCFCCEYTFFSCIDSIFEWPSFCKGSYYPCIYLTNDDKLSNPLGLYSRWDNSFTNLKKRSQFARAIANLPERPLPLRIWKTHVVWNSRSFFTEERCIKSTCLLCSANNTNYCKHGISTISDPVNYEITASCSLFRLKSAYEGNINVLN